jgi:GT2 family glycosyltransferase
MTMGTTPRTGAPRVAVVVSTYRRADRLARLVAALEAQDLDEPVAVVVVDNGSHDDTWDTLARLAAGSTLDLRTLQVEVNRGPAAARNLGWRSVDADHVAFTDDDCVPSPSWLRHLVRALDGADIAQGMTLPNPDHLDRRGPFSRTLVETEEGLYPTCNVAYRRSALERVDGFDAALGWCEDTDLAMRVLKSGGRSAWAPEAVVHHDVHPSDLRAYFKEKLHWEAVARVVGRHPELRSKLHSRYFWRAAHGPAVAAAAGIVVAGGSVGRRSLIGAGAAAALLMPYARHRTRRDPLQAGPRRRLALIPVALAGDLLEVGVLAVASVRYRTLVL